MKYVRFSGGNGYCGCDYEVYEKFEDDITEKDLNEISDGLAYENAETYEHVATGWNEDWESEEDMESYYDDALSYSSWNYCSEEEYEENH